MHVPSLPEPLRRRLIAERLTSSAPGHFVIFRGSYREMPVVRVPVDSMIYRFDNGRIALELREKLAALGRSVAAERGRADTAETQALLHDLLIAKAKETAGPIFQELEAQAQQTEPLLITADGVAVNGNRRLAAMRELLSRDPVRYGNFAEVAVAVLPPNASQEDIDYTEAALQMAPETKLPYGWLERRIKLRTQRDLLKFPVERISAAYRLAADDIAREISELELAEDYLSKFRGEPIRYSLLRDAEKHFVGLQVQLAAVPRAELSLWKQIGFLLIDQRATLQAVDRLFPLSPPPGSRFRVLAREGILKRLMIDPARPADANRRVEEQLADEGRRLEHAQQIADALDEARLDYNDTQTPERMLKKLSETLTLTTKLTPERLSDRQRARLRTELAALKAQAGFLLGTTLSAPAEPHRPSYSKRIIRPPYTKVPIRLLKWAGLRR